MAPDEAGKLKAWQPLLELLATHLCIHWLHYIPMKDVGLRIRVQRGLREQFLEVCRAQDKPAAQILREFMREYVSEHEAALPQDGQNTQNDSLNPAIPNVKQRARNG